MRRRYLVALAAVASVVLNGGGWGAAAIAAEAPPGEQVVADIWEPDPVEPAPIDNGTVPEIPWVPALPDGTGLVIEEPTEGTDSIGGPSLQAIPPAGVGDTGAYSFLEFPVSADAGLETIKVNIGSGNLFVRSRLMELAGPGVPAAAWRVHNSLNPTAGTAGTSWFSDFHYTGLAITASEVGFFDGTGARWAFTKNSTGWSTPAGLNAKLTTNGNGSWVVTYDRTGERITFNADGWPTTRVDRNGTGITYQWNDVSAKVQGITDAVGKQIQIGYDQWGG